MWNMVSINNVYGIRLLLSNIIIYATPRLIGE